MIVEEIQAGHLTEEEVKKLHLSLGVQHSVIEDPLFFTALGLGLFWVVVPRLAAAAALVWAYALFRRVVDDPPRAQRAG